MKRIALFLLATTVSLSAFATEFKAGYAKTDITAPLGVFMPGYFKDRFAKEVLDPLEAVCVAFSDGRTTALIMQLDTEEITARTICHIFSRTISERSPL